MPAHLLTVTNPRRKRRHKATRSHSRRRTRRHRRSTARRHVKRIRARNPAHRVHHRRRHRRMRARNPRFDIKGIISNYLVPAGIGGAGALALDVGLSYVPLPDMLKTGIPNAAVKVAGALALGYVGGKVLGREKGKAIAAGALTVVAYNLIRKLVQTYVPNVPGLSGDYSDMQMGAYMGAGPTGYNPAPMLQGMGAYMDPNLASLQRAQMGAYMDDGM